MCVALASRIVHNLAFPAVMMTFPVGVPENCGATATVILTDVSFPYFTDAGDRVRVVREVARRTVRVASAAEPLKPGVARVAGHERGLACPQYGRRCGGAGARPAGQLHGAQRRLSRGDLHLSGGCPGELRGDGDLDGGRLLVAIDGRSGGQLQGRV